MTDKIQKIREELARLKEETSIGLSEYDAGLENGRMEIIDALSIFLNSMQEESVNNGSDLGCGVIWKDEDLEEAVENYASTGEVLPNGKIMIDFQAEKAFRAGAKWQKNHIWHDANERPKKSGVKTAWITNDKVFYSGWYNKSAFGHEYMRDSVVKFEFDKIHKWCYLDNLLNTD